MSLANWLEEHALACPIKSQTGIDCPGCGMQRAFILLLRGELVDSFFAYPALIPVLITSILLIWQLIVKTRTGARIVMWSFILTMSIVTISFIVNQVSIHQNNALHNHVKE